MISFNASKLIAGMFAIVLAWSFSASNALASDSAQIKLSEAIEKVLKAQDDAWNRGDLDVFMQTYSKSPKTSYVSSDAQVWGYDAILARYQKRYGHDKESMGKLTFRDLKTCGVASDAAVCVGNWHLIRKSGEPLDGVFSLVFVKQKDGWKILHDHTSLIEPKKL